LTQLAGEDFLNIRGPRTRPRHSISALFRPGITSIASIIVQAAEMHCGSVSCHILHPVPLAYRLGSTSRMVVRTIHPPAVPSRNRTDRFIAQMELHSMTRTNRGMYVSCTMILPPSASQNGPKSNEIPSFDSLRIINIFVKFGAHQVDDLWFLQFNSGAANHVGDLLP
jgi:hypothetical protein